MEIAWHLRKPPWELTEAELDLWRAYRWIEKYGPDVPMWEPPASADDQPDPAEPERSLDDRIDSLMESFAQAQNRGF